MNAMTQIEQRRLGQMDWQVVEMARKDGPRSLNPDGLLARVTRVLLGVPVPQGLANDELEALRQFSVRAWFWDFVRTSDVQAFFDAGYTPTNARRILAYVAHHRGFTPSFEGVPA